MAIDMRSLQVEEGERRDLVMQIRLLGGVDLATDEGEPIDIGPPKCQVLLASLALSVGSAVPVPRLVELVWGEDPPRTAEKTLQSYVTRLRKSLGSESIERTGAAYRLAVDPVSVDVRRFQRHLAAGDIEAALAEWTGTPLAGLDAGGLTGPVDGLVEQWLGAKEAELGQLVDTDPAAAVATLTELTANDNEVVNTIQSRWTEIKQALDAANGDPEEIGDEDDAQAPDLHVVADPLRTASAQPPLARRMQLDHVVRHQAMAARHELESALALPDAAAPQQQNADPVYVDKRAMKRHFVHPSGVESVRLWPPSPG